MTPIASQGSKEKDERSAGCISVGHLAIGAACRSSSHRYQSLQILVIAGYCENLRLAWHKIHRFYMPLPLPSEPLALDTRYGSLSSLRRLGRRCKLRQLLVPHIFVERR